MRDSAATLALAMTILATAACAAGQQPRPSESSAPCTGMRTVTVRNSTRGTLEVYSATANGGNKVLLGEVQPGSTAFNLTPSHGGEFIAQRAGSSTIVAATPGVTAVRIRNNSVSFFVSCR
jgi:hypothetical protein